MIHRAIKSAGRRNAIPLLVNTQVISNFAHSAAACQQCLSKTFNTFSLSEKEKIFTTKAMVTCKRSAAVAKN